MAICRKINEKEDHNAKGKDEVINNYTVKRESESSTQLSAACHNPSKSIVLQSASVWVKSLRHRMRIRLIFDTGAQRTFMTRQLAEKLKCVNIWKHQSHDFGIYISFRGIRILGRELLN